jgi:putative FmdB family regulatory protein
MPIHEYACRGCGHEFETLVRASDTPSCASCGGMELERKLSVFATKGGNAAGENFTEPAACGTCGDPRGPGACRLN